jgi:ketosteroid isomerase-like protein
MRILATVAVAGLLLGAAPIPGQTSANTAAEQDLRRIEAETARLEQQNDAALGKFLADDWVLVGAKRLSKTEFVENVKRNLATHENGVNPYTIEKKNMQINVFGDTAVVTYVKEYRQNADASRFFDEDDTDVFTRDSSGWHLRLTKISPVPIEPASN